MAEKYNGYKNYQTWNVVLWLNNDEGLYRAYRDHKRQFGRFNKERARECVMELMPDGTPDLQDRKYPYRGVDWQEVSKCLNEE
jgi:hypothetical protein